VKYISTSSILQTFPISFQVDAANSMVPLIYQIIFCRPLPISLFYIESACKRFNFNWKHGIMKQKLHPEVYFFLLFTAKMI